LVYFYLTSEYAQCCETTEFLVVYAPWNMKPVKRNPASRTLQCMAVILLRALPRFKPREYHLFLL